MLSAITRRMLFHQLGVDASFLQLFGVGVFFQDLFSKGAMLDINFSVELVKCQGVVRYPLVVLAKGIEVTRHRFGGVVAFGYSDAQ
jgi:hypothetical protein